MTNTINADLALSQMQVKAAGQDRALDKAKSERGEIKQIADDFESLFLGIVLKSMRDTVQKSGLIDGGNAEDIYRSMLDEEYSKIMAGQRNTGLAENIEHFLLSARGISDEKSGKALGLKAYQSQGLHDTKKQATMDVGSSIRPKAL